MNYNDVFFLFLLGALVPVLVRTYLPRSLFSANFRSLVTLGGIAWLIYAMLWEVLSFELLGVAKADAAAHWFVGKRLAQQMDVVSWQVLVNHFHVGNNAYQCYVAAVHYFTGTSETFLAASNGWFAYWGGLAITRSLRETFPHSDFSSPWYLGLITCPSVVYWSTMNVKEGLMYWAICMVFSSAPAIGSRTWLRGSITFVAGMVVGCLFRPHIMIVWAGAVLAIGLLRRRRFWVAILSAVALLLALKAFTIIANVDTSVEGALEYADQQSRVLSATKGGTNIEHGPGGPVMFLSGFVTLFFRPFPWEITNLRLLLSCTETWVITTLIITGIGSVLMSRDRTAFRLPQFQIAMIAAFGFCLFFTYTPNEGLVARQRVQAFPGLFALALLPRSLNQERRYRLQELRRMLLLSQMGRNFDSEAVPENTLSVPPQSRLSTPSSRHFRNEPPE